MYMSHRSIPLIDYRLIDYSQQYTLHRTVTAWTSPLLVALAPVRIFQSLQYVSSSHNVKRSRPNFYLTDMYIAENVIPQPGETYAINKKGSDTVVTLDGTNVAMRYWENLPSKKWECVETDGWLGFFSRASTASDRGADLGQ